MKERTLSQSIYMQAIERGDDTWVPACGGHEVPFTYEGRQWLYVFNPAKGMHKYLNMTDGGLFAQYDQLHRKEG